MMLYWACGVDGGKAPSKSHLHPQGQSKSNLESEELILPSYKRMKHLDAKDARPVITKRGPKALLLKKLLKPLLEQSSEYAIKRPSSPVRIISVETIRATLLYFA
jgi:hypothetical protein